MADFLYENINLGSSDEVNAGLITATAYTDGAVSFAAGSVPGATENFGFFVAVAGSTDAPVCLVQPVDVTQFTFTSASLIVTQPFPDITLYGFDVTLTRVLAGGAASTTTALPYITVQGKTVALPAFDVTCPA